MKKSFLVVILSLLIVATGVCTLYGWNNSTTYAEGETVVHYIETEQDFLDFLSFRGGAKEGEKYILTSDLYLSRFYDSGYQIKRNEESFKGIFEGRGHAIVGLRESLFSTIGETGVVNNLQLLDVKIEDVVVACALAQTNNGSVSNVSMVGSLSGNATAGLVANNYGTISNAKVLGTVAKTGENHFPIANPVDEKIVNCYYYDVTLAEGDLDTVFNDDVISSYIEFNYAVLKNTTQKLSVGINLYGAPFIGVGNNVDLISFQGDVGNTFPIFNARMLNYTYDENAVGVSAEFIAKTAIKPNGNGTKENPYEITNESEFLYLENLTANEYAILVNDIDLSKFDYSEPLIPTFVGYFDGCGKTINGNANAPVFGEVNGNSVYNGEGDFFNHVRISDLNLNCTLAETLNTYVYNVTIKGAKIADLLSENGMIARAEVDAENAGFVTTNNGIILLSRIYGGSQSVVEVEGANSSILSCYQERKEQNTVAPIYALNTASECIYFDGTTYHYSNDIDFSVFPNVNLVEFGNKYLYTDNWSFGGDEFMDSYSWAYEKGIEEDIPVLVFPKDNLSYKETVQFKTPYKSASDKFGKVQGAFEEVIDAESITKLAVETLIKDSLSFEIKDYLSSKTFNWYYQNGTAYNEDIFEINSNYRFTYQDEIVYIDAILAVNNDGVANLKWSVVEEGTGEYKLLSLLDLQSLSSVFDELGLSVVEESHPNYTHPLKKYQGVGVQITTENGSIVEDFVVGIGNYTVEITVPSTANTSSTTIKCYFAREIGEFDYANLSVANALGGMSKEDALIYGEDFFNLSTSFNVVGTNYDGVMVTLKNIIHLERPNGTITGLVDEICDAGIYTLSVVLSVQGYEDTQKEIYFYVARRQVAIDLLYDGHSVANLSYQDNLDEEKISYHTDDTIFNVESYLQYFSYETDYQVGADIGDYYLSFQLLNASNQEFSNNFNLVAGASVNILVNPLLLSFDSNALSEEITYDGLSHQASLKESAILRPLTDVGALDYTCTYTYEGIESTTPYSFKDAGEYEVVVNVTINSINYAPLPATTLSLTIKHKEITIVAKDSEVKFNEDAVYDVEITFLDGVATEEDYQNILSANYSLTSSYEKGITEAGDTLQIILTLSNYVENGSGKVMGNYIVVNSSNGTLVVGKKTYALNMVYSYVYTGEPVALDFNGEIFEGEVSYTFKMLKDNGAKVNFTGTPRDVLGVGYLNYEVTVTIQETKGYYGITATREFKITPKSDNISGLYLIRGSEKVALSSATMPTYDGKDWNISVDYTECSYAYTTTYYYSVYNKITGEYEEKSSLNNPINLKNAVKLKDIYVVMKGNNNFLDYESEVVSSFEIKPKEIELQGFAFKTYRGTPYTDAEITKWANELGYVVGYEPIEGESVNFEAKNVQGKPVLDPTGTYAIEITPLNDNYVMTERGRIMGLTVVNGTANVNLDDVLPVQYFEYGELTRPQGGGLPYVEVEIRYALAEEARATVKLYIKVAEHQDSVITPGVYDIDSADPITGDVLDEYGKPYVFVNFALTKCEGKVVVSPMKITYDWSSISYPGTGIKASYDYNGKEVSYDSTFKQTMLRAVSGRAIIENPDVRINLDGTFKHAGEYHFEATTNFTKKNDNNESVYCYEIEEGVKTFTSVINKKSATYVVTPVTLYVGESLPTTFTFELNGKILTDTITPTFLVEGFDNAVEGDYSVVVSIKVNDGGVLYDDYALTKVDASAKEVTVRYREFDSNLAVNSLTTNYTGEPIEIPVENLPDGASVSYSLTPVNAGNYTIVVSVSKPTYRTKVFTVALAIKKGVPYVQFVGGKEIPFDVEHLLGNDDVEATVTYRGMEVEGTFTFRSSLGTTPALVFGTYEYTVDFTPNDSVNFESVTDLKYTLTSTVEEEDYEITFGEDELPEVIEGEGEVTITLNLSDKLVGGAVLVINGEPTMNTTYTFTSSSEIVLIEIMLQNEVLFSKTIKVVVNQVEQPEEPSEPETPTPEEPSEPSEPEEPSKPEVPSTTPNEEVEDGNNNLGLIIGLSAGGVALLGGGVALIIVLIKRKGKMNG